MDFKHLTSSQFDVMNFLNEVAMNFPQAISFASGRPNEEFFSPDKWFTQFDTFREYFATKHNLSEQATLNAIAQYGRTAGCINELISQQLRIDESIQCSSKQILITNGCQEAMAILLMAGCKGKVLLVTDPTYIGITGLASILGIEIISVSSQSELISAKNVQLAFEQVKLENKEVGGLYIIPDFDNPSGESFSSELRNELLEVCNELKIAIFEDNPYGRFRYDGGGVTTMYEMDKFGVVYHLGSFAKTVCPTMRIGYILCPTVDFIGRGYQEILDNLSKVKSLLSVNTSQLAQAVVGGILLENDCSLEQLNGKARTFYRSNRDTMLEALEVEFSDMKEYVSWNNPEGGFFLTVKLPFIFDKHQMEICASEYDVLVMPRAFFSVAETQDEFVRFAFSYVSPELIKKGIKSFARYVRTTMNKAGVLTNV